MKNLDDEWIMVHKLCNKIWSFANKATSHAINTIGRGIFYSESVNLARCAIDISIICDWSTTLDLCDYKYKNTLSIKSANVNSIYTHSTISYFLRNLHPPAVSLCRNVILSHTWFDTTFGLFTGNKNETYLGYLYIGITSLG